ncbi:MAG: serine/threonine protein kinase [Kofleriaceae bacterium]
MTSLLGGKYVLERRLGGGGMAEVYLGRTVGTAGFSRQVAIKRILPGYSDQPSFAEMFIEEARLSSRLRHPNVVSVLDFDQDSERRLFLVMELVDGADLNDLLATGRLPIPLVMFIIGEMLRGLGYAHELPAEREGEGPLGLVHRDVSPHNVLLSWEGEVRVSDFGIAKARAATRATASGLVKGKVAYMSPEQANGLALDGTSDLFAVGIVLWEMLCGQLLFGGDDTLQSTFARVMFAPIPSPRPWRPTLPADLERVTLRLLERDRAKRYPSAAAALAELVACAEYPRDGREALATLLAERFPARAPRRSGNLAPAKPQDKTRSRPTALDLPARRLPGPVAPDVLPAARRPPVRWLWRWALITLVIAVGTAAAVVGVVRLVRGVGGSTARSARAAPATSPAPAASPSPARSQPTPTSPPPMSVPAPEVAVDAAAAALPPSPESQTSEKDLAPQVPPSSLVPTRTLPRGQRDRGPGIQEIRLGDTPSRHR